MITKKRLEEIKKLAKEKVESEKQKKETNGFRLTKERLLSSAGKSSGTLNENLKNKRFVVEAFRAMTEEWYSKLYKEIVSRFDKEIILLKKQKETYSSKIMLLSSEKITLNNLKKLLNEGWKPFYDSGEKGLYMWKSYSRENRGKNGE